MFQIKVEGVSHSSAEFRCERRAVRVSLQAACAQSFQQTRGHWAPSWEITDVAAPRISANGMAVFILKCPNLRTKLNITYTSFPVGFDPEHVCVEQWCELAIYLHLTSFLFKCFLLCPLHFSIKDEKSITSVSILVSGSIDATRICIRLNFTW